VIKDERGTVRVALQNGFLKVKDLASELKEHGIRWFRVCDLHPFYSVLRVKFWASKTADSQYQDLKGHLVPKWIPTINAPHFPLYKVLTTKLSAHLTKFSRSQLLTFSIYWHALLTKF
jgi:hypothetical protein